MPKIKPVAERFWEKVNKESGYTAPNMNTPCWEWTAGLNTQGYGVFTFHDPNYNGGKKEKAHRLAWKLTYSNIPDGVLCLHKCDNPKCVRPNHLFLGTHKDNMNDMFAKGRHIISEEGRDKLRQSVYRRKGSTPLTKEQREAIVENCKVLRNWNEVARNHGVSPQLVYRYAKLAGVKHRP